MDGLATVFGGSGFVGAQIVRALARSGWRVRVAVRQPGRGYRLRMLGDVGQIEIVQANVRNLASIDRALDGAEACINAVGVLHEQARQRFAALHVEAARAVAQAAIAHGASRIVHISALGAGDDAQSAYARSKAAGEAAVRKAAPSVVILRPSVVFGPDDHFFNRFAAMAMNSPVLPLIGGGATRFQPVFVADVAAAVAQAISRDGAAGLTYELCGPAIYSLKAIIELMLKEIRRTRLLAPLPFPVARLAGLGGDMLAALTPFTPPITSDQVDLLRRDSVVAQGALGLTDLGVAATALEPVIPTYLYRYRKGGQYAALDGGIPQPTASAA